jgi:hypothetical protein
MAEIYFASCEKCKTYSAGLYTTKPKRLSFNLSAQCKIQLNIKVTISTVMFSLKQQIGFWQDSTYSN